MTSSTWYADMTSSHMLTHELMRIIGLSLRHGTTMIRLPHHSNMF